jgi:protein-S-isoprenylcysteine O-methyltransferase Ste14
MSEVDSRKLGLREDWASVPFLLLTMIGFVLSGYDFWVLQQKSFKLSATVVCGILLLVFGGSLRLTSRRALMKAGLSMLGSSRLQVVEGQRLVTIGVYSYIRHPLYLGEIMRNMGVAIVLSSLYGLVIILIASLFLLFRMEIEERMLIEQFGQEYEDYMKRTKRLIPYIY